MKFCSQCAAPVTLSIPEGDTKVRFVCSCCETVHYQNPKVVTGCLVTHLGKVLLCKRAIEPRYGLWTVPAGFMENGETLEEAACRETLEEAEARVEQVALYAVFSLSQISQVYVLFRCELSADFNYGAGIESLEVALFAEDDIPWDELAFPIVHKVLEYYFHDRKQGIYPVHYADMYRDEAI
jgi:ADP-ribose pyrophosphatase YjhB (NUDIX family)